MSINILEVVVDAMEVDLGVVVVGAHVWSTAREIVKPVAREGIPILQTQEKKRPVVLAIAASRPFGDTVELIVGDGDMATLVPAADDHLATDKGELDTLFVRYPTRNDEANKWERSRYLIVVNPNVIGTIQGESIAAPDILRVQILHDMTSVNPYILTLLQTQLNLLP